MFGAEEPWKWNGWSLERERRMVTKKMVKMKYGGGYIDKVSQTKSR